MMSLLAFAALAASVQPAGAQMAGMSDQHAGHGDHAMPAAAPVEATGVIRAIDAKAASVTLAHEAIPALKWPAMTMAFKVSDPALLKGMAVGTKVRFQLQGKTIVGLKAL
ncbi:MAG: copper-binding protein [Caulobacter sp.]|nr:copper-binding protein [Caulobacter vibrioides]MBQ1561748.1 copper-binding protein [Caulobacter sp.]MCK5910085.1 copper-binding protein [Caulobacter sp.]PIC02202.1 copper-binding protein [Caulobacter sp. X]